MIFDHFFDKKSANSHDFGNFRQISSYLNSSCKNKTLTLTLFAFLD